MIHGPIRLRETNSEDVRLRRALIQMQNAIVAPSELAEVRRALGRAIRAEEESGVRRRPERLEATASHNPKADGAPRSTRRALLASVAIAAFAAVSGFMLLASPELASTPNDAEPLIVWQPPPAPNLIPIDHTREPATIGDPRPAPAPTRPIRRSVPVTPTKIASRAVEMTTVVEDAPVQDEGAGHVNINSIPISAVVLDGRPLGGTPRIRVAVRPGPHTVLFVHPEHGRKSQTIHVDAGRTVLAAVRFP